MSVTSVIDLSARKPIQRIIIPGVRVQRPHLGALAHAWHGPEGSKLSIREDRLHCVTACVVKSPRCFSILSALRLRE